MFTPGNILHGTFRFSEVEKPKYAIVLYNDGVNCILTTFTTSQTRAGVPNPVHGKNKKDGKVLSYVFEANREVGVCPNKDPFSFPEQTVVVSDYGFMKTSIERFTSMVTGLTVKASLHPNEYEDLIYTLYQAHKTDPEHKKIFGEILEQIGR